MTDVAGRAPRADATRNRTLILAAAESAFAELGVGATTAEIARRAGLAVGTIFRHFPTKPDLLAAALTGVLERLRGRAAALHQAESGTGLMTFFVDVLAEAAAHKAILAVFHDQTGMPLSHGINGLRDGVAHLVADGHHAGVIRGDIELDDVMALLVALAEGAQRGSWDATRRARVLNVVFTGLEQT